MPSWGCGCVFVGRIQELWLTLREMRAQLQGWLLRLRWKEYGREKEEPVPFRKWKDTLDRMTEPFISKDPWKELLRQLQNQVVAKEVMRKMG
jgi:hypothetical protein